MTERVFIFDTTLRDGEQSPGFSMTVDEKVRLAIQLEKLGVDVIEAGFPIASEGDFEAVREVGKIIKNCEVAGLARTNDEDIDRAWEALKDAKNPRIHLFIATSPIHMKYKLNMSEEEVLERAVKSVERAKKYTDNIEFSAEDATRSDPDFLCRIFERVIQAGARVINIPDTVGYTVPEEFYRLITKVKSEVKGIEKAIISVHCHNDLGLATANSITAVKAGARQVECTINGIGERAGNASLEEIVMILKTRQDVFGLTTKIETRHLYPTSRLLTHITGIGVQPNKAIVGANAFAHEAGIHQDGILKEKSTYEIMRPEDVGIPSSALVLGKHSGRHAFRERIKEMGFELTDDEIELAFKKFKSLADKKKEVYDEDIESIITEDILKLRFPEKYKLLSVSVTCGNHIIPYATVEMEIDGEVKRDFAVGDGPVDATYKAIEKITGEKVRLLRFSISAITGGTDAQGEVSVYIEENGLTASGRGAHTDILVASARAFVNALNRLEYRRKTKRTLRRGI